MFSYEYCRISKNGFFYRIPLVAASGVRNSLVKAIDNCIFFHVNASIRNFIVFNIEINGRGKLWLILVTLFQYLAFRKCKRLGLFEGETWRSQVDRTVEQLLNFLNEIVQENDSWVKQFIKWFRSHPIFSLSTVTAWQVFHSFEASWKYLFYYHKYWKSASCCFGGSLFN